MTNEPMTNEPMTNGSRTDAQSRLSGFGHWTLVILVLAAFALRLYRLGGPEFWFDEALSANISRLGWEGIVGHLRTEPFEHPPLYFLGLYPWQLVAGTTEFALRFFSVFWGVLFVPLVYRLAKRMAGRPLALLAALLAVFSPFLVAYSQEARMYTLLPCLALLALLSFDKALQRDRQRGWWLIYALSLALGVATHYFFALLWVATAVYLLLEWPRRRKGWRWGVVVQLGILLGGLIWLVAAPGLRSSLVRVAQGEAVFDLAYKLNKIMPTLMLAEVAGGDIPVEAHLLVAGGWLLVVFGVWWSKRAGVLRAGAWRLLVLVLVVPLLISLFLPYGVLGRHLGFVLIPALIFLAVALAALSRKGWFWLAAGILVVLLMFTYGLGAHYTKSNGDLAQALVYVDEQGQRGDLLIIPQPAQSHLVEYYNRAAWPVHYLPEPGAALTPEHVAEVLGELGQSRSRLWLGPIGAWTADPELLTEQWLALNAFQAAKTWFPDSSSVGLYLTGDGALERVELGRLTWGGIIRLRDLYTSSRQLSPGEALRLRFRWRAGLDLDERYAVGLALTDEQGRVWAERRSEPCSGWCPTDGWTVAQVQEDRHALVIPPGTPPGDYHLEVTWTSLDGAVLPPELDRERVARMAVAKVTVLPQAVPGEPVRLPNPLRATFGDEVTLLGYELASPEAQPGESLHLETHWRAEVRPSVDYALLVELTDRQGEVQASWQSEPVAEFYPTGDWQPGQYLRGQHDLALPTALPSGRYRLQLALVSPEGQRLPLSGERPRQALGGLATWQERLAGLELDLGSLRLSDRPRRFEVPTMSRFLRATVGQQAHLLGYDLDLSQAQPGGSVGLTLYWQAGGPMVKPFKVFTHLLGRENLPLAQHDAPPGGGCCPTDTWARGEIVVDEHVIPLGADLSPGTYELVVGMYDEDTDSRLPAYDADGVALLHDRVSIGMVTVAAAVPEAGETAAPLKPQLDFDYRYFVPLMFSRP